MHKLGGPFKLSRAKFACLKICGIDLRGYFWPYYGYKYPPRLVKDWGYPYSQGAPIPNMGGPGWFSMLCIEDWVAAVSMQSIEDWR